MSKNYISRQENLTEKQLQILNNELESKRRSVGITYLFFIFFGLFGIHNFYLEKQKKGISYILLSVLGYIFAVLGFNQARFYREWKGNILAGNVLFGFGILGVVFLLILGILLLRDLFTIPQQVNKLEEKYKEEIISEFENKTNGDDQGERKKS